MKIEKKDANQSSSTGRLILPSTPKEIMEGSHIESLQNIAEFHNVLFINVL
jgi:hypothetical protein